MERLYIEVDEDSPICLYCKEECESFHSGESSISGPISSTDTYICKQCKERYSFTEFNGQEITIGFTCNELHISQYKNNNEYYFSITPVGYPRSAPIKIPIFEVNFDNKNKLYKKLKVLILFS